MAAGADGAAGGGEGLEAFVAALRTLEPTGERGFEGFVRDVLRSVLGRQINLMKSGPQHGGDMVADSRPGLPEITIECKRYSKPLRFDDLRWKLEDALRKNPKLDLWVIAATTQINHEDLNRLRVIAKGAGVECLDWEANPGAIPSLAALCSLAPDVVETRFPDVWPAFAADIERRKDEYARLGEDIRDSLSRQSGGAAMWADTLRYDVGTDSPMAGCRHVPWQEYTIERPLEATLFGHLRAQPPTPRWVAVTGHSGVGKSTLLRRLSLEGRVDLRVLVSGIHLIADELPDDFAPPPVAFDGSSVLRRNLGILRRRLDALPPDGRAVVALDTLDAVVNNVRDSRILADFIDAVVRDRRAVLVTTSRKTEFTRLMRGRGWIEDTTFRRLEVGDFDEQELAEAIPCYADAFWDRLSPQERAASLDNLSRLSLGRQSIHRILAHPLTLRLLFQSHPDGIVPEALRVIDLYDVFWKQKLRSGNFAVSPELREAVALFSVFHMLDRRETRLSKPTLLADLTRHPRVCGLPKPTLDEAVDALRSEEILKAPEDKPTAPNGELVWLGAWAREDDIEFFHDSFFEYAAARLFIAAGPEAVDGLIDHTDREVDLSAFAILRQVALLHSGHGADIVASLLRRGQDLADAAAVETYMQMTSVIAIDARRPLEMALFSADRGGMSGENRLLMRFLGCCHEMTADRHDELFALGDPWSGGGRGFLTAMLSDTASTEVTVELFEAVVRLARFRSDRLAPWLSWVIDAWRPAWMGPEQQHWALRLIDALRGMAAWDAARATDLLWAAFLRFTSSKLRRLALEAWRDLPRSERRRYATKLCDFIDTSPDLAGSELSPMVAWALADVTENRTADAERIFTRLTGGGEPKPADQVIFAHMVPLEDRTVWLDRILALVAADRTRSPLRDFCCNVWLGDGDVPVARHLLALGTEVSGTGATWMIDRVAHSFPAGQTDRIGPSIAAALPRPGGDGDRREWRKRLKLAAFGIQTLSEEALHSFLDGLADVPPKDREKVVGSLPNPLGIPDGARGRLLDRALEWAAENVIGSKRAALILLERLAHDDQVDPNASRRGRVVEGIARDTADSFMAVYLASFGAMPVTIWRDGLPMTQVMAALRSASGGTRVAAADFLLQLVREHGDAGLQVDWPAVWARLMVEKDLGVAKALWHAMKAAVGQRLPGAVQAVDAGDLRQRVRHFLERRSQIAFLRHVWGFIRAWAPYNLEVACAILAEALLESASGQEIPLTEALVDVLSLEGAGPHIEWLIGRLSGPFEDEQARTRAQTFGIRVMVQLPAETLRDIGAGESIEARLKRCDLCHDALVHLMERLPKNLQTGPRFAPDILGALTAAVDRQFAAAVALDHRVYAG